MVAIRQVQHHVFAKYLHTVDRKIDLEQVICKVRTIRQRPTDGGAGWSVEVGGAARAAVRGRR
ncbi:hypothetical protein [Nocardia farcinica]|uniref:hypothetical protein n=1 Tax=Nocardia farcinica TaxID=37329 RepID=UPI002453F47D|nr:hypothetical protein [Nocardia farcinica]